jgi:sugar (pentulose or hexulose) kinase
VPGAVTRDVLIGVDVGTSSCKAAAVGLDGVELAHAAIPTPWRPVATGAEVEPDELADAALAVALDARERADGRAVAVGVCSMAETGVLLDRSGEPVVPAIAWHDGRGAAEAAHLTEVLGGERFTARTGLPPSPLCSVAKLRWLRANDARAERGVRWLNVAEWVVRRLGGDEAAELSLASRTAFMDVAAGRWWSDALRFAGARDDLLPELVPAGTSLGPATAAGLDGAVLTVGGHDHLCAQVGAAATRDGDVFDSCGSAEAVVAAVEPPVAEADVLRAVGGGVTVGWHLFGGRRSLLGGFRSGLGLQRFLDLLGVGPAEREALSAAACTAPRGAAGLRVVDLTDEHGRLEGIGDGTSPPLVWRAALEAAQDRAAAIKATVESIAGPTTRLVVAGGWSRDAAVRTIKNEVLGPFERPPVTEAGARGAALLAGIAAGVYGGVEELPAPEPLREAVA